MSVAGLNTHQTEQIQTSSALKESPSHPNRNFCRRELSRRLPAVHIAILVALSLFPAALSWHGSFVWDDVYVVATNTFLDEPLPSFARQFWKRDYGLEIGGKPLGYYRPIVTASLKLNQMLFGRAQPTGYRATNTLIHAANVLLFYACLFRFFAREKTRSFGASSVAFVSAAILASGAWNVESIAFVSARGDLLFVFFLLAGGFVGLYGGLVAKPVMLRFAAAVFLLFCALVSKESAIGLIACIPVLVFILFGKGSMRAVALCGAAAWIALVFSLLLRHVAGVALPFGLGDWLLATTWKTEILSLWQYMAHACWPGRILIIEPGKLSAVHFGATQIATLLISGVVCVGLVAVCARRFARIAAGAAFCGMLLLGPILLLHGRDHAAALSERYLYAPLIGFAACLGVGICLLMSNSVRWHRIAGTMALVLLLGTQIVLAASKYHVWSNEIDFWRHNLDSVPRLDTAPLQFGLALKRAGKATEAGIQLTRVLNDSANPVQRQRAAELLNELRSK